jgi:hypothetical protein
MTDLDLAPRMGVGTNEVRIALRGPVQRGDVTFARIPQGQRMLALTESGVQHLTLKRLELEVLDLPESFGPR